MSFIYQMNTQYSNRISKGENGVRPLSTVLTTLEVLEHLAGRSRAAKLFEIADALGLSRPTAYQRLLTLIEAGWVEQDEEGRYRLSLHSCRISAAALEQASLGERATPILERLVAQVSETASLAVLDKGLPCIVQRVESEGVLRAELKIGATLSLAESASGRILAAYADEGVMARLKQGSEPLPDEALLAEVRRDGYAASSGHSIAGIRALAAPVFDVSGRCVAALSLVGPAARFSFEAVREPMIAAARQVTAMMQGTGR